MFCAYGESGPGRRRPAARWSAAAERLSEHLQWYRADQACPLRSARTPSHRRHRSSKPADPRSTAACLDLHRSPRWPGEARQDRARRSRRTAQHTRRCRRHPVRRFQIY
ncbi:MAG: hypothetical protein AMK72_02615 [Planctomycetes bacterium SM23_25]|nr:MAG: hypothetical protein AMK72_02615 [Planctomycetes bacterium SM23_25]